jgi:hypothetical protein
MNTNINLNSNSNYFIDSIVQIQNKKTKEFIPILSKNLLIENSKYSSTKEEIVHLFINNEKITKSSDYYFTYLCSNCNTENGIGSTQILRKIRKKNFSKCFDCSLKEHNGKPGHNLPKVIETKVTYTKEEFHELSKKEFENMDDLFKHSFILSHLTEADYARILPNILSFENGNKTDLNNYDFWSVYKVNNQMRFSSVLYDKINKCIFKANQPIIRCDHCEKNWRCKSLEKFKNSLKLLCPDCTLCNRTFKIRSSKNLNNEIILYQSKLELKFIEWCKSQNFLVTNGPSIQYDFHDKIKKYKVDFQIDDILIEIKDFHIWHKNKVESGQWSKKENAVNNYILEHGLRRFFFITPNNWNQMCKELVIELKK